MAVPLRVAVVLAGAVAKGAFEAGVLQALARTNVNIVRVVAASSGALNGTLLASAVRKRTVKSDVDLLAELWRDNAGWTDVFHANLSDITERRAVSDSKNVLQLLHDRIPPVDRPDVEDINLRLLVAPLNGVAGTIGDHAATTFESVRDFDSADFATAAKLERVFDRGHERRRRFRSCSRPSTLDDLGPCVDGGAVNNTPIKWALEGTSSALARCKRRGLDDGRAAHRAAGGAPRTGLRGSPRNDADRRAAVSRSARGRAGQHQLASSLALVDTGVLDGRSSRACSARSIGAATAR